MRGTANGVEPKGVFFSVFVAVSVVAAIVGFAIPRIISAVPIQLINLPNKGYWLAPEHRIETQEFFNAYFAWFGCAVYLIVILTFDYAIQHNLHPENPPDAVRMLYVLAAFLLFTAGWTIRMLAKFLRTPEEKLGS